MRAVDVSLWCGLVLLYLAAGLNAAGAFVLLAAPGCGLALSQPSAAEQRLAASARGEAANAALPLLVDHYRARPCRHRTGHRRQISPPTADG